MTELLEDAIAKVRQLSEAEQDANAQLVLNEIESERRWDELFAKSPEKLAKVADRAWVEHETRDSEEQDADRL